MLFEICLSNDFPIETTEKLIIFFFLHFRFDNQGLENLMKYGQLPHLIETLMQGKCSNEMESLTLKAAIWALGHASTSTDGIEYLNETAPQLYEKFIFFVKHSEVYSIRAVALHALGLVATTKAGADILFKYGKYLNIFCCCCWNSITNVQ